MHAKTFEALPCPFSFPSVILLMTDKFVPTPFFPTPFCQHSLSYTKSVRKRRGGEAFCFKVSSPMLQIHRYQNK